MRFYVMPLLMLLTCSISFSQSKFITKKCKNASNERIRKNCIINEIQAFVNANYDIAAIATDAKPGKNRIYTRFKIHPTGKIVDIQTKSSSFSLEVEAIRVLESFPYLIPVPVGNNDQIQEDIYTLPIVFEVQKPENNDNDGITNTGY